MQKSLWLTALCVVALAAAPAAANIIGQHHFTWWDTPGGVVVTAKGAPPPVPNAIQLIDLDEWHLDTAQTSAWYAGAAVAGLPPNPFNPANRTGIIGAPVPVNNAEAFIYQITNVGYGSGNGLSFSGPAGFPGVNDLSGINIIDTGGVLGITAVVPGSQFISTTLPGAAAPSTVLDLTPGSILQPQDWDFNAFSGAGNFEWDISPAASSGVVIGQPPAVLGFALPGNWLDAVNNGWIHSWNPQAAQVNLTPAMPGFSGPRVIPEPVSLVLLGGGVVFLRRRRRKGA